MGPTGEHTVELKSELVAQQTTIGAYLDGEETTRRRMRKDEEDEGKSDAGTLALVHWVSSAMSDTTFPASTNLGPAS